MNVFLRFVSWLNLSQVSACLSCLSRANQPHSVDVLLSTALFFMFCSSVKVKVTLAALPHLLLLCARTKMDASSGPWNFSSILSGYSSPWELLPCLSIRIWEENYQSKINNTFSIKWGDRKWIMIIPTVWNLCDFHVNHRLIEIVWSKTSFHYFIHFVISF